MQRLNKALDIAKLKAFLRINISFYSGIDNLYWTYSKAVTSYIPHANRGGPINSDRVLSYDL